MSTPTRYTTYSVPGISCEHCERAIRGELARVDGVEEGEVDLAAKTVAVRGEAGDEAVRAAIADAGYDVE